MFPAGGSEQNVGDALAFASRQPRRNEGIRRIDLWVYPQRPARQEDRNGWHTFGMQSPQQLKIVRVVGREFEILPIALEFCVRAFAEHDDGGIGFLREPSLFTQHG